MPLNYLFLGGNRGDFRFFSLFLSAEQFQFFSFSLEEYYAELSVQSQFLGHLTQNTSSSLFLSLHYYFASMLRIFYFGLFVVMMCSIDITTQLMFGEPWHSSHVLPYVLEKLAVFLSLEWHEAQFQRQVTKRGGF